MNFVSRTKIKESKSTLGEPLFVKQWDAFVNIRKISGKQRAVFLMKMSDIYGQEALTEAAKNGDTTIAINTKDFEGMFRVMAEMIAMTLCDESGKCLYDSNSAIDIDEIENFDADLMEMLFNEASSRNGITDNAVKSEIKN